MKPTLKTKSALLSLFAWATLAGCKQSPDAPYYSGACDPGYAIVTVSDSVLTLSCGCAEGAGTVFFQGSSATCTIPVGTTLIFNFAGIQNRHQIVATGTPDLGMSAVVDPKGSGTFPFLPNLPVAGTYGFHDTFNPALFGQIVVQ